MDQRNEGLTAIRPNLIPDGMRTDLSERGKLK